MDSLRECSGGGTSSSSSSSSSSSRRGKNKEQWNVLLITDTNFPGGALANSIGGYELFGNVVLVGAQTSLLRERVAVLKRRQTWKAHLGQSNQRKPSSTAVNSDAMKNSEPLVAVTELEKDVMVINFLASSVEDSFYLLRAMLLPLYVGYYVELDSGSLKSSVHHSSLLTSPPYSNRLPPLRSDMQSKYGRWSGCDVYKQLEEYDSTLPRKVNTDSN
jgi:hypothetical protein